MGKGLFYHCVKSPLYDDDVNIGKYYIFDRFLLVMHITVLVLLYEIDILLKKTSQKSKKI